MTQQLNLLGPRAAAPRGAWGMNHAAMLAGGALALPLVLALGLQFWAQHLGSQSRALALRAAPLRASVPAAAASASDDGAGELAQLRAIDAGQARIRVALESGLAGTREGHADYLVALARQTNGAVWITGFSVAEDGSIDIEGRMNDAAALTDYLRRLDAEPRFRGRPFAQLSLNAMDSRGESALPYTEFALRSHPQAPKAGP